MISGWMFVPVVLVLYLLTSIKILKEYERGVVFRLGRVLPKAKGPGIALVFAPIDRMVRMSLRIEALEVPAQENTDPEFIANPDEKCQGESIHLAVAGDGKSYTVTVGSKGKPRRYETREIGK